MTVSVLVGAVAGISSPARTDTPLVGVELSTQGGESVIPLDQDFEHGLIVLDGAVEIGDRTASPGELIYLGTQRADLGVRARLRREHCCSEVRRSPRTS